MLLSAALFEGAHFGQAIFAVSSHRFIYRVLFVLTVGTNITQDCLNMKISNSLICIIAFTLCMSGQILRVPDEALGERIVVVVPMVGKGTVEDPIRPKYAPVAMSFALREQLRREGKLEPLREKSDDEKIAEEKLRIGAYSYVMADDGKRAIVEFVARDRAAFAEILKDATVRVVDKGKLADAAELEEFRKVKKDFEPAQLRTAGY